MLVKEAVQLVLAAIVLWRRSTEAAPAPSASAKVCGRQLSEIMTRVCHAYNSPSWDVPTVVEHSGLATRRKRQLGIADECCLIGCTWEQLSEYCSISAYSESPLENMEHNIEDRSAETKAEPAAPAPAPSGAGAAREVGRRREGRRCRCRRKRDRRLMGHMGNMGTATSARAGPVVGTVSPLITWGRTLNTDLPTLVDSARYAYVVRT